MWLGKNYAKSPWTDSQCKASRPKNFAACDAASSKNHPKELHTWVVAGVLLYILLRPNFCEKKHVSTFQISRRTSQCSDCVAAGKQFKLDPSRIAVCPSVKLTANHCSMWEKLSFRKGLVNQPTPKDVSKLTRQPSNSSYNTSENWLEWHNPLKKVLEDTPFELVDRFFSGGYVHIEIPNVSLEQSINLQYVPETIVPFPD